MLATVFTACATVAPPLRPAPAAAPSAEPSPPAASPALTPPAPPLASASPLQAAVRTSSPAATPAPVASPWTPKDCLYDLLWAEVRPFDEARTDRELARLTEKLASVSAPKDRCDLKLEMSGAVFSKSWVKDPERAAEALRRARAYDLEMISECPERADLLLFGIALADWRLGDRDAAAEVAEELIRRYPDSDPNNEVSEAWFMKGERDYLRGRTKDAVVAFTRAARVPHWRAGIMAKLRLAHALGALGRWKEAMPHAQYVASLDLVYGVGALAILREGQRAFIEAYSHVGAPEAAWKTCTESLWGERKACLEMLEQLRAIWVRNKRLDKVRRLSPPQPNPPQPAQ